LEDPVAEPPPPPPATTKYSRVVGIIKGQLLPLAARLASAGFHRPLALDVLGNCAINKSYSYI
jgi:hypothetical protein